jgi:hypothetical protein
VAGVERQELFKKEINLDNIGSLEDRYAMNVLLYGVPDGRRSGPKTMLGLDRSCLLPGNGGYSAPSLQWRREMSARGRQEELNEKSHERTDIPVEIQTRMECKCSISNVDLKEKLFQRKKMSNGVRFEVFTAVTMKNAVFGDVTPCGSSKIRGFGRT